MASASTRSGPRLPRVQLRPRSLPAAMVASPADVVAVAVSRDGGSPVPRPEAEPVAAALGLPESAAQALARADASGEAGEVVERYVDSGATVTRLLLVGVGDGSPMAMRRAGAALARRTARAAHLVTTTAVGAGADGLRAHVEGLLLGAYSFSRKSGPGSPSGPALVEVEVDSAGRRGGVPARLAAAAALGVTAGTAGWLSRDLANTPSNEKDPAWLAAQARQAARRAGLDVSVRDARALAAAGFGGLVAVGQGSSRAPRLIELRYRPPGASRRAPHVVLVGKGITFDSGGLSLKPRDAMVPMKTDMAGGGAVIAAMSALREAGVRVPVTGLVAAAENMPGASAQRPGDVIRHYGGRTVEVFNTDAEGRLVLADALAYADAELEPDLLVDVATLTGAASIGLGRQFGALFTGDDALAEGLVAAGRASGERLWRLPLVEDYRPALDSTVADLSNIGRDPAVQAGAITAALFLREFVGGRRWAHLDIAGPSRSERAEHETNKGGTGFGARLLLRWLEGLR